MSRENLVTELRNAAEPLTDSCTPEVSAKVGAAVDEAVTAYHTTCSNLKELCTKYHNAAELWKRYKEASDLVKEWIESPMESVDDLPPEEAIEKVRVSCFLSCMYTPHTPFRVTPPPTLLSQCHNL